MIEIIARVVEVQLETLYDSSDTQGFLGAAYLGFLIIASLVHSRMPRSRYRSPNF